MMSEEEFISCCIGCKQGPWHPVEDQAEVKKLEIGIGTDSHGNNPEINNGNLNQIIGVGIPLQGNHSNCKTKKPLSGSQNWYILRIEDNSQEG